MADVALDPQNSNSKELFGQGVRAYVLQDYDTAVRAFSKVSELLSAEHGNDMHDSLGDVYLYYGKSLLELSRKESGPLGEGVLKNVDEGSESEEIQESDDDEDKTETTNKLEEVKANEDNNQETEKTEEAKSAEDAAKTDDKPAEEASKEDISPKKEGEESEEELTDLQVAWEVLELAKRIFINRGADGKKNLAETLIVLGEISLESGNFSSAIEDMTEGLEIQKTLFGNDSRTIAETYYKLGGALSTNGQIDEAIENFYASYEYLSNKVTSLKKDEEHKEANAEEIEELNNLIPEVQEKIADMKNLKMEVAKKVTAPVAEAAPSTNGTPEASSSSKQANDISHLVKRKRKDDDDVKDENPAKKPSP
ncbi:nuclear autoantigenic sperm protein [Asbolus verrucosus]|uniref:Nuclear autoantigenic sperm protein n=1 Tax=Asbolus verrucosus TaxID=1661398 RepID=A0A482VSH6_ASBVE|nr:nuclear autoantigenic sperm protein [Asbolus verrucosus]